jgi:hypothetical protein
MDVSVNLKSAPGQRRHIKQVEVQGDFTIYLASNLLSDKTNASFKKHAPILLCQKARSRHTAIDHDRKGNIAACGDEHSIRNETLLAS